MDNLFADKELSRRAFLRLSACASGAAALTQVPGLTFGAAPGDAAGRISIEECLSLAPGAMAERSAVVRAGYEFLLAAAGDIADPGLREMVKGIVLDPAPTFMAAYQTEADKEGLRRELVGTGLLKAAVTAEQLLPPLARCDEPSQQFSAASGSTYDSHHAYPGGLVVHTALNVKSSLSLCQGYHDTYGVLLDRDVVLAAQLLHDLHKPWVLQWQEDGATLPECQIAGTGAHHILSLAETIYRGLPPEVLIAQASAHDNAGSPADEARLVGYIKAAAAIAGQDPVAAGLLAACGGKIAPPRRIEPFVTYLGDHDWTFSVPAARWTIGLLEVLAVADYGMGAADLKNGRFNTFRNYIFSQATMIALYQTYVVGGPEGLRAAVHSLVEPAETSAD
ncbi:TAT (twin-arginine translocation) pathway signal sequence [Anaeroselena agilis]|uniref:TAT (Twin-arginine translocation) pathway signal sequence n=1 Tax=Anaeroselena agilis TaxID=3063788 RepID=A0ABU3NZF7_9FIRM|nr:TAT (twin-arginine translocation) pathway signal sequence [Selenomonadales bacterium 4137-cl]